MLTTVIEQLLLYNISVCHFVTAKPVCYHAIISSQCDQSMFIGCKRSYCTL